MASPAPPRRHTTFPIDLALLGGQDPGTSRALPWATFTAHWDEVLPACRRAWWNFQAQRLEWVDGRVAPPQWSTQTWPDFRDPLVAKAPNPEQFGATVLRMALHDVTTMPNAEESWRAFGWLLRAGVSSNVWLGHGASVLSQVCLNGNIKALAAIAGSGQDLQATLLPGAVAREDLAGSSLLHRVGPSIGQLLCSHAAEEKKRGWRSVLAFLFEHAPDPDALDGKGRTALGRIAAVNPALEQEIEALRKPHRAQRLGLAWGLSAADGQHQRWVEQQNAWATKGKARGAGGEPLFLVPHAPDDLDPFAVRAWPRPFREGRRDEPGAVVLRCFAPSSAPAGEGLNADSAWDWAVATAADAIVERTGPAVRWWVFHPRQLQPALAHAPAPSSRASPRL